MPLALAWDLGARDWTDDMRLRFANDPANLLAVQGRANQDKSDQEPAYWMPPNHSFWCQYAVAFVAVLRGYALPVDLSDGVTAYPRADLKSPDTRVFAAFHVCSARPTSTVQGASVGR